MAASKSIVIMLKDCQEEYQETCSRRDNQINVKISFNAYWVCVERSQYHSHPTTRSVSHVAKLYPLCIYTLSPRVTDYILFTRMDITCWKDVPGYDFLRRRMSKGPRWSWGTQRELSELDFSLDASTKTGGKY